PLDGPLPHVPGRLLAQRRPRQRHAGRALAGVRLPGGPRHVHRQKVPGPGPDHELHGLHGRRVHGQLHGRPVRAHAGRVHHVPLDIHAGAVVPTPRTTEAEHANHGGAAMTRMVQCAKLGKELPGMSYKYWDNELGQRIYDNISMDAWRMWVEHSKMLVNEYRLDLTSPKAQQLLMDEA